MATQRSADSARVGWCATAMRGLQRSDVIEEHGRDEPFDMVKTVTVLFPL
jgi:hypothetical protein